MSKISFTFSNHGKDLRKDSNYYSNHDGRAESFSELRAPAVLGLLFTIIEYITQAHSYYVDVATTTMPSDNAGDKPKKANQKVNLSEIQSKLVKRGKPPYENPVLATDILSLDPNEIGDAFVWSEATVNLNQDSTKIQAEKMKYRNRAESVSEKLGIAIQINWLDDGRMVISRKANA